MVARRCVINDGKPFAQSVDHLSDDASQQDFQPLAEYHAGSRRGVYDTANGDTRFHVYALRWYDNDGCGVALLDITLLDLLRCR